MRLFYIPISETWRPFDIPISHERLIDISVSDEWPIDVSVGELRNFFGVSVSEKKFS